LLQDEGRCYLFETQKTQARWHEIDPRLLEAVWRQHEAMTVARDALLLEARPAGNGSEMPRLPDLASGGGFTIEMSVMLDKLNDGQVLLDSRDAAGRGICVDVLGKAIRLRMNDGRHAAEWCSDAGLLTAGRRHHVAFIVDGGPKIISIVVDGRLCDGGAERRYGWTHMGEYDPKTRRVEKAPGDVSGDARLRVSATVQLLRIYSRPLLTSEVIANARAGRER
jgi:hypothetical protein